ncbi:hypothetical protein [Amycolatopsis sp. RTGN1]|uniref:hypothetical protein n=1 Tax=Amycolatopsis ponsaeliensis TaxID=2992142 RepID=UPI00254BE1C1|nr:hypothetical protein [Amycolatopsis sp. RTGN1]
MSGYTQTDMRAGAVPDGATGWHNVTFTAAQKFFPLHQSGSRRAPNNRQQEVLTDGVTSAA